MTKFKTAFITGASTGIGRSLALEFAQAHYNLVVVARNKSLLESLKIECEKNYGVKVFVISTDLSRLEESLSLIKKTMEEEKITVDVLVNNAGFGIHGEFAHSDLNREIDMVNLQTNSVLCLTKLFVPHMVEQKSGAILNVGSVYSFTPVPYQSVYGACKSFLLSFSLSLAHELKKYNIKVTAVCPGTTRTEFRSRSRAGHAADSATQKVLKGMSAEEVAKQSFEALCRGDVICVPGAANKLFVSLASFVPSPVLSRLISYVNNKRGVNGTGHNI